MENASDVVIVERTIRTTLEANMGVHVSFCLMSGRYVR